MTNFAIRPLFTDLLLQILHSDPDLPKLDSLVALSPDQWRELTTTVIRYRAGFQMLAWVRTEPQRQALVPPACLDHLADYVRKALMRNLGQQAHLRKMLVACQAEGLPVMLLKGLWLGEVVYRDLKARSTGDIDLLLQPQDMPRFTKLVQKLGFDVPPEIDNICDIAPQQNEYPLRHPQQKSYFDLHWSITHPVIEKPVDEEKLWARSEVWTIAGMPCRSLGLEDHLLYLCFHAAIHHQFVYVGPRALLDVAVVIANPPRQIDWTDLVQRAQELGWARGVWLMLDLVQQHLGVPAPPEVMQALRPKDANDAAIHAIAMDAKFIDQQHLQKLPPSLISLMDEQTLRGRVGFILGRIFKSREGISTQFARPVDAPGMHWLYINRWGHLFKSHFSNFARLVAGNPEQKAELKRMRMIARWIDG
jgi:hypothetical protein